LGLQGVGQHGVVFGKQQFHGGKLNRKWGLGWVLGWDSA
jgi:hypothetical protein